MAKKSYIKFGKYKEKTFEWVAKNDPDYYIKMRELKFFRKYSKSDVISYQRWVDAVKDTKEIISSRPHLDSGIIEKCLVYYYEKNSYEYVFEKLQEMNLSYTIAREYMTVVRKLYSSNIDKEKENLIQIHVNRYENMYLRLKDKKISKDSKNYLRYEVFKYLQMISLLQAKEKILGIHSRIFKVQLNNYYQAKKIKALPDLDFTQLTIDEKKQLISLFDKCKEKQNEFKIIPNTQQSKKIEILADEAEIIESPIQQSNILIEKEEDKVKPTLSLEELKKQIQLKQAEKLKK